jgi:Cu-processing system permease protein
MNRAEPITVPLPSVSFWVRWVTPVLVIARLTIKEATRRWAFVGGLLLGVGMMALLAYVFANVKRHGEFLPAEVQGSLVVHFGLVITRFFSAVMATALACGAIATELERGTLTLVVTKPIRRWQIVVGKWLGFAVVLTLNQLLWLAVIEWGAWNRLGTWHWGVWKAGLIGLLYPLLFVSLNLLLSVHLPWIFVALISLVFMGIGWSETAMRNIGTLANLPRLLTLSQIAGYLMPTGRIARWMVVQSDVLDIVPRLSGPPGVEMPQPTVGDLLYVVAKLTVLTSSHSRSAKNEKTRLLSKRISRQVMRWTVERAGIS